MISIGLAGWGDHPQLYGPRLKAAGKLAAYSEHFPIVEADSTFYAVPKPEQFDRWAAETPASFSFLIKAFQEMTGHARGLKRYDDEAVMFREFLQGIEPCRTAGKLFAVLFQYPPWFDCTRANVELLRRTKARIGDLPAALEFRHRSWFTDKMRDKTLAFMEQEGWIHSICDEPDAGPGSIPAVLQATDRELTVVRFHGRNTAGWNGGGRADWREVRYLYRYNEDELQEWAQKIRDLERQSRHIAVIFNNNSGGDAAGNAKQLMRLLGMTPKEMAPEQMEWSELTDFEG